MGDAVGHHDLRNHPVGLEKSRPGTRDPRSALGTGLSTGGGSGSIK